MKKEVLIAILVGFTIGLIVIFGVITAQNALKTQKQTTVAPTPSTSQNTQNQPDKSKPHSLTISEPINQAVISTEKIILAGTTSPKSTIAVTTPSENLITVADDNGQFKQEITLTGGTNIITITSFSPTGEKAQTEITLVYSTAEF